MIVGVSPFFYLFFSSSCNSKAIICAHICFSYPTSNPDFTRLKLVQSKKEDAEKEEKEKLNEKSNDEDITAQYDAQDDPAVVF